MKHDISIIIVTYNAMQWAERCFSSLRKSSVPVHTIVIDNGSTDGTQEFIQKNFPEVDFIQSKENLGFGKANNLGIEIAYKNGADFFYLMNQDAWIYEDSIAKMLNFYTTYPNKEEIGIISPIHLDGTEQNIEIFVEKYLAINALQQRIFTDLLLQKKKTYYEIDFVNAAHWFIPKHTIENVGGFNPYFFHYGEDNEYVNRVKFHQKKTFLIKDCYAVHDGKQTLKKVDYNKYINTVVDAKILDPNLPNNYDSERKSLQRSYYKSLFLNEKIKKQELKKVLQRIKENKSVLLQYKKEVSEKKPSFLNL